MDLALASVAERRSSRYVNLRSGAKYFCVFPYTMRVVGVSLYDLLRHGVLPALLPGPPMMAMLYAIRWAFEPSALFPVGCAAFVWL